MINLSGRLQQLRTERDLLQKDVSLGANLSLRTYQRYEYGERVPDANALVALADYFGVSIDYLVGRADNTD